MKCVLIFSLFILVVSCVFNPIRKVHLHTYKPLEKESEKVLKVYCTPISKTLFFYENEGILFKVKSVLFSKNDQEFIGLAYKNIFQRKGYQTLIKMADTKFHALLKVDTLSLFSSATNEVEKYQLEIDNY